MESFVNLINMLVLLAAGVMSSLGYILFSSKPLHRNLSGIDKTKRISVIIPARNEEKNIPFLLRSLAEQTVKPAQIIVVDDFSTDKTADIVRSFGIEPVINPQLPEGWTGKNWAVWNGYLKSDGDILVFLDCDIRLMPDALEVLINNLSRVNGAISIIPYHYNERFYERLSLVPYFLGIFAFMAPAERARKDKALYGSCIALYRSDYDKVSGHKGVRSEVLDDMSLGIALTGAKVPLETFSCDKTISFRMYPNGIKGEIEGFSKGAIGGMSALKGQTVFMIACWIIGLLAFGLWFPISFFTHDLTLIITAFIAYLLYSVQFYYFAAHSGRYGAIMPILHIISTLFFMFVMIYATYRTKFIKNVVWKGRFISVAKKDKDGGDILRNK